MALQWILEQKTDISYVKHLSNLLAELGCECNGSIMLDNIGTPVSTIGLALTARDWARWGQMLCCGGEVGSGQTIPGISHFVNDIRRNPQTEMWTAESNASSWFSPKTGYRSLVWTAPAVKGRPPVIFAHGAFHQKCYVDPDRNLVLVKFSSLAEEVDPNSDQIYGTDDVATQSFLSVVSDMT
jgi:CubicO group peptidase (beta-lactamase class C family)